ncbi:MAG: signal peptidase I [Clostridia bacterium]|nr:signal peptidase I [Clostridia bacterium]
MKYDIETINKRKENVKIAKKVIEIIAIILIYNIILIAISSANQINVINIFGYKSYIIKTNSMEPTIKINDVVITKKVEKQDLKIGDVITFLKKGEVITHRITQIEDNSKYTTKGDNNNIEDTFKIDYKDVEGKHVLTIPYLGAIVRALDNKIVFLIITLIILIFMFITIINQEKRENRREKKKIEDRKRKNENAY